VPSVDTTANTIQLPFVQMQVDRGHIEAAVRAAVEAGSAAQTSTDRRVTSMSKMKLDLSKYNRAK
jgi:hypothetical protein